MNENERIMTLATTVQAIETLKENLRSAQKYLEETYTDEIYRRIGEMSLALVLGREKPYCCNSEFAIPFAIAQEGVELLKKKRYPTNRIKIGTISTEFCVTVDAIHHDELDNSYDFKFPADDAKYVAFIEHLRTEGRNRVDARIEREKQLLRELRNKYPVA